MSAPITAAAARSALKEIDTAAESLEMFSTESEGGQQLMSVGARRRRRRAGASDPVSTVSLVMNDAGVLLWQEGDPSVAAGPRRGLRRGRAAGIDGDLVELYQYEKLVPNEINQFLTGLDGRLNDHQGLRRVQLQAAGGSTIVDHTTHYVPTGKKRRLLFVHGIFSKCDAFFDGIGKAPNGAAFWKRVFAHYDEVLAFEHPTVSVSPVLNAYDLSRIMAGATGPLDVIAHSRGGLVTRWFLEGFSPAAGPRRGVLVGSPLDGTSLASPRRLKDSLSMLSNLGTALKVTGGAAVAYLPFLVAPLALLKIATSVIGVAAKTPLIDAAVSMIPGLAGCSRVALNHELERMQAFQAAPPPSYAVVRSNFETEDAGWRFWKWFRVDKLKDVAADKVFPGANDLVVDTLSTSQFVPRPAAPIAAKQLHDFGTSDTVHHTNYFEQPETLDFMLDRLAVP